MKKAFLLTALCIVLLGYASYRSLPQEEQKIPPAAISTLGFIRDISESGSMILFDDARWLTGKEGEDATIAAGRCTEETRTECLPNGFFIENVSTTTRTLSVALSATVIMQTWRMEEEGNVAPRSVLLSEFAHALADETKHWKLLPYTLTVQGDVVTRIEEVYVP